MEGAMGIVTVRCPATGKEVPTGIVLESEVFQRANFGPRAFVCDACGEPHVWEKQEATVHLNGAPVPFKLDVK
jgi:hypothetical protein